MMSFTSWGEVFSQSLIGLWYEFINFVPSLLGAIILFIIGCLVASLIGKAITQLVGLTKVDKFFENPGSGSFLGRTGFKFNLSKFLGGLVKWFIIIVFLIASLQILGLTEVNNFLREAVIYYLPKVIVACLVLIIATVLADVMRKLIVGSAKAVNVRSSRMIGSIVYYAIWIFAFVIALSELGFATAFMQILFTGLIAAIAIALGISFGIGGKDTAVRILDKISKEFSSKE